MVVLSNFLDIKESLPEMTSISLPVLKQNCLNIEFIDSDDKQPVYNGPKPPMPFANSDVFYASITDYRCLADLEDDYKSVYEVTFDVEDSNYYFKAGDTIGIIPQNVESDVNYVINHLDLNCKADLRYALTVDTSVKGSKIPAHIPVKSTLRYILTHCLDLRSILKKLFLLALSKYTKSENERKVLEYLCSKEGSMAYTTHILNRGLCILDIFSTFTSCKPPLEILLANLPRLLPRPYSIVNSGLKNNKKMTICFSVMTINRRKGLTTGWLETIISNKESTLDKRMKNMTIDSKKQTFPIYLRKNLNMFSLPQNTEKPLILIGPGTGVAPFIGFLEEREFVKESNPDIKLGDAWLFYGCRDPKLDFIYEDELNSFLSRGILHSLFTAHSRVDNAKYKHIQDALAKNIKEIITLVSNEAIVYVCGDLKTMELQVREILLEGFIEHGDMTKEEARITLEEMQKNKRYIVDAWC